MVKRTYWSLIAFRYLEVHTPTTTTSASVSCILKAILLRHGICTVVMNDNGLQYSSQELKDFANQYKFKHVTSSPHYPQSNGMAERMHGEDCKESPGEVSKSLPGTTRIQDHSIALVWTQSCTASNG